MTTNKNRAQTIQTIVKQTIENLVFRYQREVSNEHDESKHPLILFQKLMAAYELGLKVCAMGR